MKDILNSACMYVYECISIYRDYNYIHDRDDFSVYKSFCSNFQAPVCVFVYVRKHCIPECKRGHIDEVLFFVSHCIFLV